MRYAIVIEKGPTSFGAYVPDLPGCVAVGDTREEVARLIEESIEAHVALLREIGDPVPQPSTEVLVVEVS